MRSLVVSSSIMFLLMAAFFSFHYYSDGIITDMSEAIDAEILNSVESGQWERAHSGLDHFVSGWKGYEKYAAFFLSTDDLEEISVLSSEIREYIVLKDAASAAGRLACLKERLTGLNKNEEITSGNVF